MNDSDEFWRKNVRAGTTMGKWRRGPTIWQRIYDFLFNH